MSETRLRFGRKVGRTLYEHTADDPDGRLVGMVDTPELAAEICRAVNTARDAAGFYEDDEPVERVLAAWERGVPRTTTAPGSTGANARLDTAENQRCCKCGSTRVAYRNVYKRPFCWPCADDQPWPTDPGEAQ